MGADMLVTYAAIDEGQIPAFEAARTYIARASLGELLAGSHRVSDLEEFGVETLEELREALGEALEALERAVNEWDRQVTTITRRGEVLYVTGGLSTGDSPTELFDEMELLHECGVMSAAGFHR